MDPSEYLAGCGVSLEYISVLRLSSPAPIELVAAIIKVESAGRTSAMRYEKDYQWLCDPEYFAQLNKWTVSTETQLQRFSYGLMQVMGSVIRENSPTYSLNRALLPDVGVEIGTKVLERLIKKHKSLLDAVSSYNQGSPRRSIITRKYKNQNYVDKVVVAAEGFGLDLR